MLEHAGRKMGAGVELIAAGDHAGPAEQFAATVTLGHGSWRRLPRELKQTLIDDAPTFLDEAQDPEQLVFDLEWVRDFSLPTLLTFGDQSPPLFGPVVGKLTQAMPTRKS